MGFPRPRPLRAWQVPLLAAVASAACATTMPAVDHGAPLLQPGAPGESTRTISTAAATDLSRVAFTNADVQFMQGMIGHHAQAVEMVGLLKTRTMRADLQLLARRIEASQVDEIQMMTEWLQARGQSLPDAHAHHMHDEALMPGMLTMEQMAALAAAQGAAFDRLFLAGMIRHHEGALTMVRQLFAAPGAAQESEIFAFASDVDADQRMEIERMGALLNQLESSR